MDGRRFISFKIFRQHSIPQYTQSSYGNSNYNPNCLNPRYVYISNEGGSYIPRAYYNAYAIETSNICPSNWHVATEQDYIDVLQVISETDTTDSYYGNGNGYSFEWPNAGPELKSSSSNAGWSVSYLSNGITGEATNETNLSFENMNNPQCTFINNFTYSTYGPVSYFYTSTPAAVNGGNYTLAITNEYNTVNFTDNPSYYLYRVRCVKD